MIFVRGALAALALCLSAPGALAQTAPPGALACGGCHGAAGAVPPLRGRGAAEITAAMQAFRAGSRPATVMDRIAKGFSDEETRAIADWWAGRPQ